MRELQSALGFVVMGQKEDNADVAMPQVFAGFRRVTYRLG